MNLRLGIHATTLTDPRVRGFNRYTLELLTAMARQQQGAPVLELFAKEALAPNHLEMLGFPPVNLVLARPHLLWEQAVLPWRIRARNLDVFHAPANLGLPAWLPGHVAKVVTIHDMISHQHFTLPSPFASLHAARSRLSYEVSLRAACTADAIITVSEYSRTQIERYCPAVSARVHVVYNGVSESFTAAPPAVSILRKHGLGPQRPYFLYAGGYEPRKNVGVIARALAAVATSAAFEMVLVGSSDNVPPRVRQELDMCPAVRWTGYVSDDDLRELYRGALAVVFPSLEEGFGLPLIEAMACGAPGMSSSAASLPEVGGDAVEYFHPSSPAELAALLQSALNTPGWREPRSKRAVVQAKRFSWMTAAQQTLAVYASAFECKARRVSRS